MIRKGSTRATGGQKRPTKQPKDQVKLPEKTPSITAGHEHEASYSSQSRATSAHVETHSLTHSTHSAGSHQKIGNDFGEGISGSQQGRRETSQDPKQTQAV